MNFRSGSERTRPPGTSGSGASRAPLGVGVGTALPVPPQPALRTEETREGGGEEGGKTRDSQLAPRASRGRTCARSPARPGVGCGSSAGGEGAPWDGEAAWTRPGPAGEAGGRPRSATAAGGGRTRRPPARGNFAPGARATAQVRRGLGRDRGRGRWGRGPASGRPRARPRLRSTDAGAGRGRRGRAEHRGARRGAGEGGVTHRLSGGRRSACPPSSR